VIILNAEDGADDTVVPRLIAAGADLNRVHIVSAVLQEGGRGRRTFNLQADLALLEQKIAEIGDVVLVIIDPVSSYTVSTSE
jgi:putative DNA primase/helicase